MTDQEPDRQGLVEELTALRQQVAALEADLSGPRQPSKTTQQSEARLRDLIANLPDLIFTTDRDGRIGFINRSPAAPPGEVLGTDGLQCIAAAHQERARRFIEQAVRNGEVQTEELQDVDGRWWLCRALPLDELAPSEGALVICTEISQQREAHEALRESEKRYRLIAENVTDFVWAGQIAGLGEILEREGQELTPLELDRLLDTWQFTFASPSAERVLGYPVDEIIELTPRRLLTPLSFLTLRNVLAEEVAFERGQSADPSRQQNVELQHVRRDGRLQWCEVTMSFVRDRQSRILGIEGVTRDITERRALQKEASAVSTREQQRIGQQLHDELGQQLLGVALMAENLRKALSAKGLPEANGAEELVRAAREAQNCVRAVIRGLRPVEVDANGLMAALAELAAGTEQLSHVRCSFDCQGAILVEESHTATQLFHIVHEAVRNAVTHANAGQIVIGLEEEDGQLRLRVCDDGVGIAPAPGKSAGMGLRLMRYRAALIGADLTIMPAQGGGTEVLCVLPLESGKQD
jgi:PAS domain S-box-containing protein